MYVMALPSPIILESAPSPWLLPVLLFLIAVEVGFILGRRWFSEPLASQVSSLAVRKYELLMSIKMVGATAGNGYIVIHRVLAMMIITDFPGGNE